MTSFDVSQIRGKGDEKWKIQFKKYTIQMEYDTVQLKVTQIQIKLTKNLWNYIILWKLYNTNIVKYNESIFRIKIRWNSFFSLCTVVLCE